MVVGTAGGTAAAGGWAGPGTGGVSVLVFGRLAGEISGAVGHGQPALNVSSRPAVISESGRWQRMIRAGG
jgi:hypothetical protein